MVQGAAIDKRRMKDFRLYVITGEAYHPGRDVFQVIEAALRGGADFVQLRDKTASKMELLEKAAMLRELTRAYGVPFVVNDHPDVALAVDADGVHLGQDDMPLSEARRLLGPDRIIGISTHSIAQARAAERGSANYIGVGPVFPTGTKPGRVAVTTAYVKEAAAEVRRIPFVAIGGITPDNAAEVLAAGATRLCAVSAIVGSEDPEAVCRRFRALLENAVSPERRESELAGGPAVAGQAESAGEAEAVGEVEPAGGPEAAGEPVTAAKGRSVTVNGRCELTEAATLMELALKFGLERKAVVAELNGTVVTRDDWEEAAIEAGATVEFIHFVGGG